MISDAVAITDIGSGVVQITMQDRLSKNTFSAPLVNGLLAAFEAVGKRDHLKAVLLTGYDNYFAAGGTQDGLLSLCRGNGSFADSDLYSLPLSCRIPVIAAMQGHGIGGGFVFGMFADFVVLGRECIYTANFMQYGFTPGMGATYILSKKLGAALGSEMLMAARRYRGEELERRGIAFPVVARAEVLPYARALADDLATKPRHSLITLKDHLVSEMRAQLPLVVEKEIRMHRATFGQPEVEERIRNSFGQ